MDPAARSQAAGARHGDSGIVSHALTGTRGAVTVLGMAQVSKGTKQRKDFDRTALEKLGQPFAVTVEQDIGGRRTPVTLPEVAPGVGAGRGFDAAAAEKMGELLPGIAGGGLYVCKAYDEANNTVEWEWWYDPTLLPRKPTDAVVQAAVAQMTPQVTTQHPPPPMSPGPQYAYQPQQAPQPQPFGWMQRPNGQPQAAPPPYYPPPQPAPVQRDPFEDPLWKEREKSLRLEADAKLREVERAAESKLAQLAARIDSLGQTTQAAAAARPAADPALEARIAAAEARAQAAEQRAKEAEEKAQRDRDRSEMLGAIGALEQRMMSIVEGIATKIAAAPPGPDPTIALLVEHQRASADLSRETLRSVTDSIKDSARGQMTLADVMALVTQINDKSGASVVTQQISGAYGQMLGMFREIVELNQQMRGSDGNPIAEIAGQAVEKVGGAVQAYIEGKKAEEIAKSQAQAVTAQANASAQAHVAAMAINARNGAAIAAQHAAQGPLGAPPPAVMAPAVPQAPPVEVDGEEEEEEDDGDEEKIEQTPDPREIQIFGKRALPAIKRLRVGVATGELNAMQAAQAIAVGASRLRALGEKPPVFALYEDRVYGQVVEALLPDAAPDFRRQVAEILTQAAKAEAPPPPPPN